MNHRRIRKVLQDARAMLEVYASKQGQHYRHRDLNCMCGISSYMLFQFFKKMGLHPMFCMNKHHCFLRVGEYWVDLTLTQFDNNAPRIWFRKRPYNKMTDSGKKIHRQSKNGRTIKKIRRMFWGWPSDQNPFKVKDLPELVK